MLAGLVAQVLRPPAAFGQTKQTGIGRFPPGGILSDPFASLLSVSFHVEQVIRDLKQQPKTAAITIEAVQ